MHAWNGWGMGWGMAVMMLVWLLVPLAIGVMWLRGARGAGSYRDPAKDVLRRRFARGEIDVATFRSMLAQLGGSTGAQD